MSETDPFQPLTALVEQWRYQSTLSNGTLKQGDGWRVMQICADELDDLLPALREQWVQLQEENKDLLARVDLQPKAEHGDLPQRATGDAPTREDQECECEVCDMARLDLASQLRAVEAERDTLRQQRDDFQRWNRELNIRNGQLVTMREEAEGDAATLRGYINTFKETPSMTASNRDHWKARAVAAEALVADLQQQIHALSAWRDMASAPIDGTIVQVTDTKRVSAGRFIPRGDVGPLGHWYTFDDVRPTGWLPLPALPSTPQEK